MEADTEHLQRYYYSSLSDEALMEIVRDRTSVAEAAQKCYDKEVAHRQPGLSSPKRGNCLPRGHWNRDRYQAIGATNGEKPVWYDEASEVYSIDSRADTDVAKDEQLTWLQCS